MTIKNCQVLTRTDNITEAEWLDFRRSGIGGSDAGTIIGTNTYSSAFTLWAEKRGTVTNDFTGNEATEWGHLLENVVATRFATSTGARVVAWPVMLQSTKAPFLLANVDFFITEDEAFPAGEVTLYEGTDFPNVSAILEIKTTGIATRGNARAWANDGVPAAYLSQGAHYALVTGLNHVYFAALVGGEGLVIRERTYSNHELTELFNAEEEFWRCVETGEAPEPVGVESDFDTLKALYPEHTPGTVTEADDFLLETVSNYRQAKVELDEVEARVKQLRASIELAIGDAEAIEYEGTTLLTYKASKAGETFDAKAFKEAHPDLAAQFTKVRPGFRTLRLKEGN